MHSPNVLFFQLLKGRESRKCIEEILIVIVYFTFQCLEIQKPALPITGVNYEKE